MPTLTPILLTKSDVEALISLQEGADVNCPVLAREIRDRLEPAGYVMITGRRTTTGSECQIAYFGAHTTQQGKEAFTKFLQVNRRELVTQWKAEMDRFENEAGNRDLTDEELKRYDLVSDCLQEFIDLD